MIAGVGIDMCRKDRFVEKLDQERFLKKAFHPEELARIKEWSGNPHRQSTYLAGRWAAKESFVKALGLGIFQVPLSQLCALRGDVCGVPRWSLDLAIQTLLEKRGIGNAFLSISYEDNLAVAMTVLECIKSN